MKIQASAEEGRLYMYLSGELDHHAAGAVMTAIEKKIDCYLPRDCILDMKKLTFMDSSGIAVILKSYKRMNEIGGRLWVENVQPQPMRVLDASGIERIIKISAIS